MGSQISKEEYVNECLIIIKHKFNNIKIIVDEKEELEWDEIKEGLEALYEYKYNNKPIIGTYKIDPMELDCYI
jgi:hypothetical protein